MILTLLVFWIGQKVGMPQSFTWICIALFTAKFLNGVTNLADAIDKIDLAEEKDGEKTKTK